MSELYIHTHLSQAPWLLPAACRSVTASAATNMNWFLQAESGSCFGFLEFCAEEGALPLQLLSDMTIPTVHVGRGCRGGGLEGAWSDWSGTNGGEGGEGEGERERKEGEGGSNRELQSAGW